MVNLAHLRQAMTNQPSTFAFYYYFYAAGHARGRIVTSYG